jgi:endonuclease/exonuclease/phosphatase family metal-dependent hydrolase
MSCHIMVGRFHEITGGYESFPEDLRALARVMRESGADIILMQEVDMGAERSGGTGQARFLGEELSFHYSFAGAIEFQGGHCGVALLLNRGQSLFGERDCPGVCSPNRLYASV